MLRELFAEHHVAIVLDDDERVAGVLTKIDLVEYLTRSAAEARA